MIYVEAVNEALVTVLPSIFLAGGITDCPDWQSDVIERLEKSNIMIFNPRRKNFPIHDQTAAQKQIEWEHKYLRKVEMILFWFPKETLCPIVLYELGAWSMTDKPIFLGIHPEYKRRQDVEIQTRLVRPDIKITYSIEDLVSNVLNY